MALFALMLVRVSGCMVTLPVFGTRLVPVPAKILLSLLLTLILFPVMKPSMTIAPTWSADIILLTMREAFIGAFMGFLGRLMFMGMEIAGQLLGFSLGF